METRNIFQRLADINKEVGAIQKTKKNTQQNFLYRGIDDVMIELHDLFAKHEVFITQKVIEKSREERPSKSGGLNIWSIVTYEFTFAAPDGTYITTQMVGEAMDSGDKGNNKCVSVALKYALINMFSIPTKEQQKIDTDRNTVELSARLPQEDIKKINDTENLADLQKICHDLKIKKPQLTKAILDEYNRRKDELGGEI